MLDNFYVVVQNACKILGFFQAGSPFLTTPSNYLYATQKLFFWLTVTFLSLSPLSFRRIPSFSNCLLSYSLLHVMSYHVKAGEERKAEQSREYFLPFFLPFFPFLFDAQPACFFVFSLKYLCTEKHIPFFKESRWEEAKVTFVCMYVRTIWYINVKKGDVHEIWLTVRLTFKELAIVLMTHACTVVVLTITRRYRSIGSCCSKCRRTVIACTYMPGMRTP